MTQQPNLNFKLFFSARILRIVSSILTFKTVKIKEFQDEECNRDSLIIHMHNIKIKQINGQKDTCISCAHMLPFNFWYLNILSKMQSPPIFVLLNIKIYIT